MIPESFSIALLLRWIDRKRYVISHVIEPSIINSEIG